ncbi:ABC transporter substrate-binding protein [Eubacterium multiforme]|uniref:Iron complex transport system substrate-binding protein n=1 Tax=Eubacterium multiforme TaxID=83339 RepID=A0ABT9UT18_9FIRM|nr:ABC transporter substrate-binding protein [Eubacterium multiforme]MDQ0149441.1 iron complex transport system substrate-binding protein [Eubacterium multiforme]
MRRMKKFTAIMIAIMMSLTLFTGCFNKDKASSNNKTIEVEDQLGRKVKVKSDAKRIISSYYISTSILVSLGAQDQVVGIEGKAKTRELYKKAAKEFLKLPAVGSGKEINVEECMKLKPDVVIIPTRLKRFIPQFEKLNIPVIAIEPETLDAFNKSVELIGKVSGKEARSKELLKYYDDTLNRVKDMTKDIKSKPKVYVGGSNNILRTCTSKMYQNYMIDIAGGKNVTENINEGYWTNISAEQLIKYNPDVIYIVGYAKYTVKDVLNDSRLKGVKAIKDKKVYVFPSKLEPWDYPTPSSILGILWIVNNLHSDKLSTEQFEKDAKEFYKKFYNIDVTNKEIGIGK